MDRLGRVEYRPISVREALIEIKDLSELMIDLAYSSVLFNSRELAEEVVELGERVDTLVYVLNMNAMLAARNVDDAESLSGVLKVGAAADKISDAAVDIAAIVLRGIGIHPLVREVFSRSEEQLSRAVVRKGSILVGKRLSELDLAPKIGVDVIALRRDKTWIINPEGERIREGDVIIFRGAPHGLERLKEVAEGTARELEEVSFG
ncbi:potassium channel protein [Candidatus Bathyarchaeota archaeon]|mgnify:CR=1 FL=1|nr:MAG: potassium channel protein [Candidatus Bathyarchaeota archaeon]RLI32295.1 MAG: potassium channel protein [Candidatus Bathyarchaeota archaeon]